MQGYTSRKGQRDVVARKLNPLESVMSLDVAEAVPLLLPVGEFPVHEVWYSPFGAGPDCLGDQRIRRSLVPMLDQGQALLETRLPLSCVAYELGETNQAVAEKRADKDTPVKESRSLPAHSLEILPVVPERLPLSDRRLIVDGGDPLNKDVVERNLPDRHPVLCGSPDHVPSLIVDLSRQPVVEGGHTQGGHVVPLHRIVVLWRGLRQLLGEREEVDPDPGLSHSVDRSIRILQELEPLRLEAGNADHPSLNLNALAANLHESPQASTIASAQLSTYVNGMVLEPPRCRKTPNVPIPTQRAMSSLWDPQPLSILMRAVTTEF